MEETPPLAEEMEEEDDDDEPTVAPMRPNRTSRTSWLQYRPGSSSTLPAGAERSDGESGSGDESGSEEEGQAELPVGWQVQDDVAQRPAAGGDLVGRRVLVWWGPGDPRWFCGDVTAWDISKQDFKGLHRVSYLDGDKKWHFLDGPSMEKSKRGTKWALQSGA